MRYFYATIQLDEYGNFVCTGVRDTYRELEFDNHIRIESFDIDLVLKKIWENNKWTDNPNYAHIEIEV